MGDTGTQFSKEEFAELGDAFYDRDIAPQFEKRERKKFVAIVIETAEGR